MEICTNNLSVSINQNGELDLKNESTLDMNIFSVGNPPTQIAVVPAEDTVSIPFTSGIYSACGEDTSTEPQLLCPEDTFILKDKGNYTINWIHNNPVSTVVNYDLRINQQDPCPYVTHLKI